MRNYSSPVSGKIKAALFTSAVLCGVTPVIAAEVTLKTLDGKTTISGELLDFANDIYTIQSNIGPLNVRADSVECTGEACPVSADVAVVWDVSLWGKRRAFTEHVERIAELVDERTNGKFTLNLSYGDLSPSKENLDGIAAGKFEMAQFCAGYHPDKNPSITVLELPFLGVASLEQEIDLSFAVYEHPATIADMARWNATLLMPTPLPQYNIIGVDFPPTSLAGFAGMKIRASGGVGRAIEALGAQSVSIPAPKVQEALNDGEVAAVAFAPHAHMAFGTIESGSWWTTNLNPGTVNCPVVVNTAALEKLASVHRVALLSSVDEALDHYVDNYNGVTMDAWGPALMERGIFEITITDKIVDTINQEVAAPAADAWIKKNSVNDFPAQELYQLVQSALAEQS